MIRLKNCKSILFEISNVAMYFLVIMMLAVDYICAITKGVNINEIFSYIFINSKTHNIFIPIIVLVIINIFVVIISILNYNKNIKYLKSVKSLFNFQNYKILTKECYYSAIIIWLTLTIIFNLFYVLYIIIYTL